MHPIHVSMLPSFAEKADLSGHAAVMIDILRASTTIVHALANGAETVRPCSTVEQAWEIANSIPDGKRKLGGERNCVMIDGFDFGNSPFQYVRELVAGQQIVFTTTNGTHALEKCSDAEVVLTGGFINLSAVTKALIETNLPIHLVCAGTNRQLTAEDILFAGAIADRLLAATEVKYSVADVQTQMAVDFYRARSVNNECFRETMYQSLGAQNLIRLGMTEDIDRAMEIDLFDVIPHWIQEANSITCGRLE